MGRIEDLSLVADKGLEWKSKCEAITAERDHLRAKIEELAETYTASATKASERMAEVTAERDRLRAELYAATKDRAAIATRIFNAHVMAFGSRYYEYVDAATTCDLLVADSIATQHERDAATARAEAAEAALAEERRCRQDSDAKLMGYDDRLNAAAYELAQERERLDFVLKNGLTLETRSTMSEGAWRVTAYRIKSYRESISETGDTPRAAIDAARGGGK